MNNVSLEAIEKTREEELKEFHLSSDDLNEARSKIKIIDEDESNKLGKELFEMLTNKTVKYQDYNFDEVIELIYKGANINYKDEEKENFPLLVCARKGFTKTAFALIRLGADVNLVNNYLTTATMAAARHGNTRLLKILILMGADVNAKCKDGDTALMSAIIHKQSDCAAMLINAQASLNQKNLLNNTAIDMDSKNILKQSELKEDFNNQKNISVSHEDALNLIDEAEKKFNKLKGN